MACRELQVGEISAKEVAEGLKKVFSSGVHVPDVGQYAQLALHSHDPSLRELAAWQIGRTLQVSSHHSCLAIT